MKLKLKKRWQSIVPPHMQDKSITRFCMFPKVRSESFGPDDTPVYLNVYDLTPINGYFCWAGVGVFHSGVEVHGVEYAFGAHEYPASGIFEIEPRECPGFIFRKSIFMGTTRLNPDQVRAFVEHQAPNYSGDSYNLVVKNCNHFSEDICYKLTGRRIPKWVNRLARIGSCCNCILPKAIKKVTVGGDAMFQNPEGKKSLRKYLGSFSSMFLRQTQKETSMSSSFLHSTYNSYLPPSELKNTTGFSVMSRWT